MKMTNGTMYESLGVLANIEESGKLGYACARNRRKLLAECKEFMDKRDELLQKYGTDKGGGQFELPPENAAAFVTERSVEENSQSVIDQDAYLAHYNGLVERYETANDKMAALEKTRSERLAKAENMEAFIQRLMERTEPLDFFDERLWLEVIDQARVGRDGQMTFKFQNGTEINL